MCCQLHVHVAGLSDSTILPGSNVKCIMMMILPLDLDLEGRSTRQALP